MMAETKPEETFTSKDDGTERQLLPQACEMLGVICFTGGLILLYSRPNWLAQYVPIWLALFLLLTAAVTLFICTVTFTYRSLKEAEHIAQTTRYVITGRRIQTLGVAKVPQDVLDYLETIKGPSFTKEEFLSLMVKALGPERTDEVKAIVLKYTKVYEPPRPPASKSTGEENAHAPAVEATSGA